MKFLSIVLALFGLICCQFQTSNRVVLSASATDGSITHKEFGGCDTLTGGVALVIDLWEPAKTGKASEKIRTFLTNKMVEVINPDADSAKLPESAQPEKRIEVSYNAFASTYNDFKKDFPQAHNCWNIKINVDTVMITEKLMIYQFDQSVYTGGAHPNSYLSFHIFDPKTGDEIDKKTFVADSVALLKKVESAFRKEVGLSGNDDLEKAGYFGQKHKFFVAHNYTFTTRGVHFYYNRYESAPYAWGVIKFTIPYSELEGIVRKDMIF